MKLDTKQKAFFTALQRCDVDIADYIQQCSDAGRLSATFGGASQGHTLRMFLGGAEYSFRWTTTNQGLTYWENVWNKLSDLWREEVEGI